MSVCLAQIFRDTPDLDLVALVLVRLALAALLGGIIGFERQWEGKSAGLRTHMLVSLGAALFAVVPFGGFVDETAFSRVIQGVATGVGFLGAGAILKASEEHQVRGLTTAASIWVTAGTGLAIGAGYLWPGIVAVGLAWCILYPLHRIENYCRGALGWKRRSGKDQTGQG